MNRHQQARHRQPLALALIFAMLLVMSVSVQSHAHFLFIRIGTQAEAGRSAEVYFSEQAEAGDPRFIPKVAHTKLWVQTTPGEFHPLPVQRSTDRLRAPLPPDRSLSVIGECQYGVIARPNETPFLLRHYPKAVAGTAAELNRMSPRREIPFEILATIGEKDPNKSRNTNEYGNIQLTALRDGRPIPNAVFTAIDSELTESTIKAGPEGSATWNPPAPGRYSIYVRATLPQKGFLDGKAYDEIREFATLALAWPLESRAADPKADALFAEAVAQRASWRGLPGFTAQLEGWLDGRTFTGTVTVKSDGSVNIKSDDASAKPWLQDQLHSLVMHRIATPTSDSGKKVPNFHLVNEPQGHILGKLITVEDGQMASSYRIKDRQILVVNRRFGNRNMTINILENETNPDGNILPHSYIVQYWDAATGRLLSTETIQERWQRVGSWDLPASHSVTTASDGGLSVRSVRFTRPTLLGAK